MVARGHASHTFDTLGETNMKRKMWVLLGLCALLAGCGDDQIAQRDSGLEKVFRGHPYESLDQKFYDYYLTTPEAVSGKPDKIAVFYGMGNNLLMCQEVARKLADDPAVNETHREYNCEPAN